MPLPTYVNAPKAPARPVVGRNSSELLEAVDGVEIKSAELQVDQVFDQEVERRASNG